MTVHQPIISEEPVNPLLNPTIGEAVVIKDFWADTADSAAQGLSRLNAVLAEIDHLPKDIVIISAGEVKPLLNPLIKQFCQTLEATTGHNLSFISAACTSLHGAILDFNHSISKERLIITLELDQSLQQGCLNALGIGNEPEQDGLSVVDCMGFCLLSKEVPGDKSLIIEDCQIFSQPMGMVGIQSLIKQLSQYLQNTPDHCHPISFDICSLWGKKLLKGLNSRLAEHFSPDYWLPSIEQDNRHFLSLKPTLELQLYQKFLTHGNLLMMTLGGGGRVGCLRISRGVTDIQMQAVSTVSEHCVTTDTNDYNSAINRLAQSKSDYQQGIKATLKYPQHQYRGLNNHYFRWSSGRLDTVSSLEQISLEPIKSGLEPINNNNINNQSGAKR
jgi:hypothetical protein